MLSSLKFVSHNLMCILVPHALHSLPILSCVIIMHINNICHRVLIMNFLIT